MLQTAMRLLSAEDTEKRRAAELFLRFALNEQSDPHSCDIEELLRMDFREVAMQLTGSDSFQALSEYYAMHIIAPQINLNGTE